MLFKITGSDDLSKDDIENLKAHGFKLEFKKVSEDKEDYYNSSFRIIEYYTLFINIETVGDLLSIYNILDHELIITKYNDLKEYDCLEVHNGYR